jgi:hypothetical protein
VYARQVPLTRRRLSRLAANFSAYEVNDAHIDDAIMRRSGCSAQQLIDGMKNAVEPQCAPKEG